MEIGTRGLLGLPMKIGRVRFAGNGTDGTEPIAAVVRMEDEMWAATRRRCWWPMPRRSLGLQDDRTATTTRRRARAAIAAGRWFGELERAMDLSRIAIVNRGEPAVRAIHAIRELSFELGVDLRSIALYTDADHQAMFVREADESYALGAPTFVDAHDGETKSSYLDFDRLEDALVRTAADAAWVGWGFVAEQAEFAELCVRLGVKWIGPSPDAMRRAGDKIVAKRIAEAAGITVTPWSNGPVTTLAAAQSDAARLGYPIMVKAAAGGGGRGIRWVDHEAELDGALRSARAEALKAFGDDTLFLEQVMPTARHIEVQIIADHYGTVWPVGVRDCSVQRRHQKLIEEAPSPALTVEQDAEIRASAARLMAAIGYTNAGTVEFLYDPVDARFVFMEVNARLQVEHPITEVTTGLDLVKLQLRVAAGERLEGQPPTPIGHAIEARLNAEDSDRDFAPAPGEIELLRFPAGPGLRIDTGFEEGDKIAAEFDSMIAKVIAHGRNRDEAVARLRRALAQASVLVRGGTSNRAFLQHLVSRPDFRLGEVDVGWTDRLIERGEHRPIPHAEVALCEAGILAYDLREDYDRREFLATAARGRPFVGLEVGRDIELSHLGEAYPHASAASRATHLSRDRRRHLGRRGSHEGIPSPAQADDRWARLPGALRGAGRLLPRRGRWCPAPDRSR